MIRAVTISLNDGRSLLFKPLNIKNFESFKASGKIESMEGSNDYFLHAFSDGNEKIYVHTKNFKNFVIGVLTDDKASLINIIDKIWVKFEKYLIGIDMIDIDTKNLDPSLFQSFKNEIENMINEII